MAQTTLTIDGRLARLRLDRPERRNAITPEMLTEIVGACATVSGSGADVLVLSGSGRDFSVGFDLDCFGEPAAVEGARLGGEAVDALRDVDAVTIADLSGWVVGGAVALAAACDLRVATAGTTFRIPEVPLGIPLGWGAVPLLVETMGAAVTKELVMTGRNLGLDEAVARGFVNRIGAADELVRRLLEVSPGLLRETRAQVDAAAAVARTGAPDAARVRAALEDPAFAEAFARYRSGIGS